jgi:hypothetical protein
MPNLLHSKDVKSEYSYFDINKLKLFAGPNIWKYTNLLNSTVTTTANPSIIQQQQAPAIRSRINSTTTIGPKRSVRIDIYNQLSIDQIMLNAINGRDKKSIGISQSALLLRIREKSLNQMQLARKLRPLTDLINSHHFPELNFQYLQRKEQEQIQYDDFDDLPITNDHDEGKNLYF